jgi:hypothetical protein
MVPYDMHGDEVVNKLETNLSVLVPVPAIFRLLHALSCLFASHLPLFAWHALALPLA